MGCQAESRGVTNWLRKIREDSTPDASERKEFRVSGIGDHGPEVRMQGSGVGDLENTSEKLKVKRKE